MINLDRHLDLQTALINIILYAQQEKNFKNISFRNIKKNWHIVIFYSVTRCIR